MMGTQHGHLGFPTQIDSELGISALYPPTQNS